MTVYDLGEPKTGITAAFTDTEGMEKNSGLKETNGGATLQSKPSFITGLKDFKK